MHEYVRDGRQRGYEGENGLYLLGNNRQVGYIPYDQLSHVEPLEEDS